MNKLVKKFSGRPGSGEFRTWKEDFLRAFTLSDITSAVDQVTTISFLLDGDAAEYYHSLTKAVQDDWFKLMRVLSQSFDCISHEPVYLSRMLSLKDSEFPRHADYMREFRTCVIKAKVNTSDLQMRYLVTSRFVEGLSNDAVCRQYIVEVHSRWRSNRPFGFDTLVETIAEAYIAAGYQLEEVQNASRTTSDHTLGPAVSRRLPMMVPPTSTSTFPSNPMPTPHVSPMPTPAAAPTASTVPEPMNLDAIAKLREELHAYIGERRNERFGRQDGGRQDGRESSRCYNCGEQGHLARDCPKLIVSIVAMYHESEFYGHSGVLRTMALIKRDSVCSHLPHYVERYILSCDVCQAAKSRRVDTARVPRPLPVPDTKWHSVSVNWVSGLPPTTRGHDAIMTVVDRFSKRGMFIPCGKDMTADDLIYVFLREVVRLKGCPRQIVSDRDKLFESQAWKELAQRFKIEMHQTVANRPRGNRLAERSNQWILQPLRTHGIFGNNEWDVDLLFAGIQFNNLTSIRFRLSLLEIDERRTPHFPLDFPRMTSHAHEPSTVNDYMQRAERTFDSVRATLAEERRRQMHVVLQMDRRVGVPEVGERWWVLVPEYPDKGKLDVVWCGPYKVREVLNKGENVKLDIPAPLDRLRVFNRDSIKPYVHREGQPVWEFTMPPVKTGESPRLVKILARRRVGSRKRRTFLYRCEWDDDTWSWESSKALQEDPVYLEFR